MKIVSKNELQDAQIRATARRNRNQRAAELDFELDMLREQFRETRPGVTKYELGKRIEKLEDELEELERKKR